MIIDALRFRVKWHEIELGKPFNSPALRKIRKAWQSRGGLKYSDPKKDEIQAKVLS